LAQHTINRGFSYFPQIVQDPGIEPGLTVNPFASEKNISSLFVRYCPVSHTLCSDSTCNVFRIKTLKPQDISYAIKFERF
jgi:hypothetical protein